MSRRLSTVVESNSDALGGPDYYEIWTAKVGGRTAILFVEAEEPREADQVVKSDRLDPVARQVARKLEDALPWEITAYLAGAP